MANRKLRAKANGGLKATEVTEGDIYFEFEADPSNASASGALTGSEPVIVEQGGNPVKTTTQAIADLASGGGGSTTWTTIDLGDINRTPASTSTITTSSDLTGTAKKGMPCAVRNGSTWYYGQVTNITSGLITIRGHQLTATSNWIEELKINTDYSQLVVLTKDLIDLYRAGTTGEYLVHGSSPVSFGSVILNQTLSHASYHIATVLFNPDLCELNSGNNFYWQYGTAQLISCQMSHRQPNSSTQPQLYPSCNGGGNPFGSNVTLSTANTRVSGGLVINKSNAQIEFGEEFSIIHSSGGTYADEGDLFIEACFVLETAA